MKNPYTGKAYPGRVDIIFSGRVDIITEEMIMSEYYFTAAQPAEAEEIFALIDARIRWMDEMGIEQWNKSDYWKCYPRSYYFDAIGERKLYVVKEADCDRSCGEEGREEDGRCGRIAAAVVLRDADGRWPDDGRALYVHNLVTALDAGGAGAALLRFCERLAAERGKEFLRLDCAASNRRLNDYYEEQGYTLRGNVSDGAYAGNLREKALR